MSGEIAASGEADMDEGWEQHIGPLWYRIVVGLSGFGGVRDHWPGAVIWKRLGSSCVPAGAPGCWLALQL